MLNELEAAVVNSWYGRRSQTRATRSLFNPYFYFSLTHTYTQKFEGLGSLKLIKSGSKEFYLNFLYKENFFQHN